MVNWKLIKMNRLEKTLGTNCLFGLLMLEGLN